MLYVQTMVCRKKRTTRYVPLVQHLRKNSLECIYIAKNDTRTFQCQVSVATYKKNGYPGETYIVKRNCSLERVVWWSFALCVVLMPVDAGLIRRCVGGTSYGTVVTHHALFYVVRQIGALVHTAVLWLGTDIVPVLLRVRVVGCKRPTVKTQNVLTTS